MSLRNFISPSFKPCLWNTRQARPHKFSKSSALNDFFGYMIRLISQNSQILDNNLVSITIHHLNHRCINHKVKFTIISKLIWWTENFFMYLKMHLVLIILQYAIKLFTIIRYFFFLIQYVLTKGSTSIINESEQTKPIPISSRQLRGCTDTLRH